MVVFFCFFSFRSLFLLFRFFTVVPHFSFPNRRVKMAFRTEGDVSTLKDTPIAARKPANGTYEKNSLNFV